MEHNTSTVYIERGSLKDKSFKLGFVPFQSLTEILANAKNDTIPKKGMVIKMETISSFLKSFRVTEEEKQAEQKYNELMEARQELEYAWTTFNEVTEKSYIDIAIMKLNLAKKRFEVLIEENKN